jgi:hypothetical protein
MSDADIIGGIDAIVKGLDLKLFELKDTDSGGCKTIFSCDNAKCDGTCPMFARFGSNSCGEMETKVLKYITQYKLHPEWLV